MTSYLPLNIPIQFGLEFEHDSSPAYNIDNLAADVYAAGYGLNKIAYGHRSAAGKVYYVHTRGWITEYDESVSGGEVISPVMTDNEETWMAVDTILNLIKNNGGTVSPASSCHIHMDTSILADDKEKWEHLYSYMEHFSSVLYELGTYGTEHRGQKECQPIMFQSAPTAQEFREQYKRKTLMLNTSYVRENGYGHVEYRVNDASLDYALTRAQTLILGRLMMLAGDKVKAPVSNDTEAFYGFVARPEDWQILSAFRGLGTKDRAGHALRC